MYQTLLFYHNSLRWLVLAGLLYALYRAGKGYFSAAAFSGTDNAVRHWTATIAHVQLTVGLILYFQSPLITYFMAHFKEAVRNRDIAFFGLLHSSLMLVAVVCITIGSAISKRKQTDRERFRVMLIWFSAALILIFIAVPWPFSPFAQRPYYR